MAKFPGSLTPFSHPSPTLPQVGTSMAQMWLESSLSTSYRIGSPSLVQLPRSFSPARPPLSPAPLPLAALASPNCPPYCWEFLCARRSLALPSAWDAPRSSLACLMGFYSSLVALQGPSCYPLLRGLLLCRVDFLVGEWSARGRDHVAEGQTGLSGILGAPETRRQGCSFVGRPFPFEDGGVYGRSLWACAALLLVPRVNT